MPPHRRGREVGDLRVGVLVIIGREQAGHAPSRRSSRPSTHSISAMGEVDLVVVLSHQDASAERSMAAAVPAVDVVKSTGTARRQTPRPSHSASPQSSWAQAAAGKVGCRHAARQLKVRRAFRWRERPRASRNSRPVLRSERKDSRPTGARQERRVRLAYRGSAASSRAEGGGYAGRIGGRIREPSVPVHRIHNTLWSLSDDVADHPAVIAMVEAAKPRISAAASLDTSAATAATADSPFVGSAACAGVHAEAQAQWKSTPHASAWSTLVREGRERDLDCWSCHVTGAHHPQGPQHLSQVAGLGMWGVRPVTARGKAHVASPQKANIVRDPTVDVCTDCHDGIKDEGRFDLAKYRPQVLH